MAEEPLNAGDLLEAVDRAVPTSRTDAKDLRLERVRRLNTASQRRIIDPDVDLPGSVGEGQIVSRRLLSLYGSEYDFTPEEWERLAREEIASIADNGVRFECILMAAFAWELMKAQDMTDPRVVYALHELGEETRHSRLFSRLIGQLKPTTKNPFQMKIPQRIQRFFIWISVRQPALLCVLVLGGEEIPDLIQKRASEDPETDPFLREVNLYHRREEARHVAFARTVLAERWAKARPFDRFAVKYLAPNIIAQMFWMLVHPGVYTTVNLPPWRTWVKANRLPARVQLRREATRPIVQALFDAGILKPGKVPVGWRALAGVDRNGKAKPPVDQ